VRFIVLWIMRHCDFVRYRSLVFYLIDDEQKAVWIIF